MSIRLNASPFRIKSAVDETDIDETRKPFASVPINAPPEDTPVLDPVPPPVGATLPPGIVVVFPAGTVVVTGIVVVVVVTFGASDVIDKVY